MSQNSMDYFSNFRRKEVVQLLVKEIHRHLGERKISLMEVCGGHTASILRFGLSSLLPENLSLLSGPGCPVCVTPRETIDAAIACAKRQDIILATFGDLVRVPGSGTSLEQVRSEGARVEVIYGPDGAVDLARQNPDCSIVLVGIGFETTAPTSAAVVLQTEQESIRNFYLLSAHKVMPPAMKWLVEEGEVAIDGFICPGHVSTIIGSRPYEFLAQDSGIACAIAGFEPTDMLEAILSLVRQIVENQPRVEIPYRRAVPSRGQSQSDADNAPGFRTGLLYMAWTGCSRRKRIEIENQLRIIRSPYCARYRSSASGPGFIDI